LQTIIISKR